MQTKHGVIFETGEPGDFLRYTDLLTVERNVWLETPLPDYPYQLREFCEVAEKYGITHLWIMDGVCSPLVTDQVFFENALEEWDLKATAWTVSEEVSKALDTPRLLRGVVGWRRGPGWHPQVQVIFVKNTLWEWAQSPALTPKKLLVLIHRLEEKLGVPIGGGSSTAGWKYLEKLHEKKPGVLKAPTVDLSALPFSKGSSQIVWTRPLTEEELSKTHVVKLDKNSMYARSCVEEKYGAGDPVHCGEMDVEKLDMKMPGVWRISVRTMSDAYQLLPPPLWSDAEWVGTPVVKMLIKRGYSVTIHEGWYFPTYDSILKKWAENLWTFRQENAGDELWNLAIKNILNETIGLASYRGFTEKITDKKRPDYRCQTVSSAWAMMFYNMDKFAKEWGVYPVLVATDALVFCTDNPDLFPDNRTSLGGYKRVWVLPMDDEVKGVLTSSKRAAPKMGLLNSIAKRGK